MALDYTKLKANKNLSNVSVWLGPSGGTTLGITNIAVPDATELNNTGGTSAMQKASQSISWNDWDFGVQASETNNEPSMADSANYEEFGQANFGGNISFYYPGAYDDPTNPHSVIYDLTDIPGELVDTAIRIDGNKSVTTAAANGDYVNTARVEVSSEQNPFTPGESKRRTVNFIQKGEFAQYTVVGPHTITAIPRATNPWQAGTKARLRASVGSREYTNALTFTSSDSTVVEIYPGGFYRVNGAAGATATITIQDIPAGTSTTVNVTVTA